MKYFLICTLIIYVNTFLQMSCVLAGDKIPTPSPFTRKQALFRLVLFLGMLAWGLMLLLTGGFKC